MIHKCLEVKLREGHTILIHFEKDKVPQRVQVTLLFYLLHKSKNYYRLIALDTLKTISKHIIIPTIEQMEAK